eukprot:NODE_466_length_7077_cov_0.565205.p5 type:complete len:140 gc:universal NODE_466_length_7077_cov_0.565205:6791-6372(-)
MINGVALQCQDEYTPNCFLSNYQKSLGNEKGYCAAGVKENYSCDEKYSYSGKCNYKVSKYIGIELGFELCTKNMFNSLQAECGLHVSCDNTTVGTPVKCKPGLYCNMYSTISGLCEAKSNNDPHLLKKCASQYGEQCPE